MNNNQLEPKSKPSLDNTIFMTVEKRSGSKMFWNKRVLTIKDGILSYYQKPIKQISELSKHQPKISVQIENILYIGPPEKPKKQNSIEITFMSKDAIKKGATSGSGNQSINSSYGKDLMAQQQPIVIRKNKDVIIWEVAFSKNDQMKEFTKAVEKLRHPQHILDEVNNEIAQKTQNELEQSKFQGQQQQQQKQLQRQSEAQSQIQQNMQDQTEIKKKSNHQDPQHNELNESKSKIQQLEQEKEQREKELEEQQRIQKEQQIKLEQELEKQKQESQNQMKLKNEKEDKLKKEKLQLLKELEESRKNGGEDLRKQQAKKKLDYAWNYHFIQAIELAHIRDPNTIDETITNSLIMHEVIAKMKNEAIQICKQIIDELCLPNSLKTIKPTMSVNEEIYLGGNNNNNQQTIDFGEDFYIHQGLIIKLAFSQIKSIKVFVQSENKDKNLQIYDEASVKALGNEFKYLKLLSESIEQQLQEDQYFPLRVPLSCLIDYKGIRAFVLAQPPLGELIQGPTNKGQYYSNTAIEQYMMKLSSQLNLKPHKVYFEGELIANNVPLALFVEAHSMMKDEYIEFRWIENEQNLPDFPPQNLNLYYIIKCADLMPLYLEQDKEINSTCRLRNEHVIGLERPLNSDTFMSSTNNRETQLDEDDVNQAGQQLKEKVKELVKRFENFEYLVIECDQLCQIMHENGINMRLLGCLCNQAKYQHIKECCLIEMISRVCKKVFRNNMADLIKNMNKQLNQKLTGSDMELSMVQDLNGEDLRNIEKIKSQCQKFQIESGLDFINLILGVGKESDIFWNQIVQKQIWYDYNFYFDPSYRYNLQAKGYLLATILKNCNISYSISPELVDLIFKDPFPLKDRSQFKYHYQIKQYKLENSRIAKKARRKFQLKHKNNAEIYQQTIKWGIQLNKLYGQENFQLYLQLNYNLAKQMEICQQAIKLYNIDSIYYLQHLIQILLQHGDFDKAIECFEQALITLEINFGQSHPAFSNLYCIMGHYLSQCGHFEDSLNLFQSALTCIQRITNQDHQCIGDIYIDVGIVQRQMKAFDQSEKSFQKALSIFQKLKCYQTSQYARCYYELGKLYLILQKYEQAYEYTEASINYLEEQEYSHTDSLISAIQQQKEISIALRNEQKIQSISLQLDLLLMRHNIQI